MSVSNLKSDQNHFHVNISNLHYYNVDESQLDNQGNVNSTGTSSLSSIAAHTSPSLIHQSDSWPHETTANTYVNTSIQSLVQPNQSVSINLDFNSSDMNKNQWQTTNINSTTESILNQVLPASLATPSGWRSEIITSPLPIPNNIEANLINSNTNFTERHEEYQNLNTSDDPPLIFASTNEAGYRNESIGASTILTQNERHLVENVETQQTPPVVLHKTLPNNLVTYQQNVSVRYLQPPTPPPHEPIIIREVRPPPPRPQSPVQIRQRPPPAPTPPPLVFRERPPPVPPRAPSQVIEKLLPPPPRPPRRMIVERYASCPPKPADVIIERWLPYKRSDRRRIFFERAPAPYRAPQEPNLLILHDQPQARVHKEFINQGVTRADPQSYLQRYAAELNSLNINSQYAHLIDEAARNLPAPPPQLLGSTNDHPSYPNGYQPPTSPIIAAAWDRMRSVPSIPHSTPYHQDYSQYNSPNSYAAQSSYGYGSNYHDDYAAQRRNFSSTVDVTPAWDHYGHSSSPYPHLSSHQVSSSSPYPPTTIRVNSDGELQHVLSDLTNGRIPTPLRSH